MKRKLTLPRLHWFFYFLIGVWILGFLYLVIAYGLAKVLPPHLVSNAKVSGLLVRNQIWQGEITITGDVFATPGTMVTISPGTVVKINSQHDNSNFDWLPWHLKSGVNAGLASHGVASGEPFWDERQKIQIHLSKLYAIGTKQQPIVFRSNAEYPSRYDINVISINHGVVAFGVFSNYRRLEIGNDVIIQDSTMREVGGCAVCMHGGSPSLFNDTFEQALRESVLVDGGSPKITDSQFSNLSGQGIVIDPKRLGTPLISHNIFEMPGQDALVLLTGLDVHPGIVSLNRFSGNSTIKIACDSKVNFDQNSIFSLITFIGNGCGGIYTFGANFWGTNDVATIMRERITNKDKRFTVNIPIVLTVPPLGVGKRD